MANTTTEQVDLDNLRLGTSQAGAGGDFALLEQGRYAVVLDKVEAVQQENYDKNGMETVVRFTFKTLKPLTENETDDDSKIGKYGSVTAFPRFTNYQVGDNPVSALTVLLNQLFGRGLTEQEAKNLHLGKLVGIKGHVVVGTSKSGKPKFDSFQLPKDKAKFPNPDPANYARLERVPDSQVRQARPQPKQVTPPVEEGDIPDPFEASEPKDDAIFGDDPE